MRTKNTELENFQGVKINKVEAEKILNIVNSKVAEKWTMEKLMDNITTIGSFAWDIRISKVSAKDLSVWDNAEYTDGNNNGKSIIIDKEN